MTYDVLYQQALRFHEQGNFTNAEKIYRSLLETNPNNPDVLNLLGLVAQAKGINSEAINLFYKAVKISPNFAPYYFNLALSLDILGKKSEAIHAYSQALRLNPNIKEAYNNLGLLTKNREYFLHAIDLDENYVEAKANLALTYDNSKAIEKLETLAKNYPNHPISFYLLAKRTNNLDHALRAASLAPESFEIQNQLGIIYLLENKQKQAQKHFLKSLEIEPRNTVALINLGNIENNEAPYQRALEIEPSNIDAHINYANLLHKQNRTSEALEQYRKAVILNPEVPEVSNNLGTILKDLGEYEEALALFFNAYFLNPKLEEISININETLITFAQINKDSHKKALKAAKNWQKSDPNNIFAQQILATLSGEKPKNDKIYNQKLFDHFADNYELVLKNINYSVARSIASLVKPLQNTTVDLGCGSGLLGEALLTDIPKQGRTRGTKEA